MSEVRKKRFIIVELGMTGLLLFARESVPSDKHVHVVMKLVNGRQPESRSYGIGMPADLDDYIS